MGAWGNEPWDNDSAADFFHHLLTPDFHDKIMAALSAEDFDGGEWRAAAWVVYQLAHSGYVWPGGSVPMAEACGLAAQRLEQIALESDEGDEFWDSDRLRAEAESLRSRRHRPLGQ
ncbi:hypothetical protein [Tuwongella immobilis]|uniref:DUF4259 domain-containing protein n=1 Tax=Tuwongella immobilis TaxID=692036 RepID=A0A6C2YSE6_9BACT|nr:hypothetical protein [Tuwongella immobilis]VIP04291.1 unnamed protein product [Tuwongella immobilis]VTS05945.1 unnamed protein product [Tuwongella immobilis]